MPTFSRSIVLTEDPPAPLTSITYPLDLNDVVTVLDAHGLASSGPTRLGKSIKVGITDVGGPGYTEMADGVTMLWPAMVDEDGHALPGVAGGFMQDLYIIARPSAESGIMIEVGVCWALDGGEYRAAALTFDNVNYWPDRRLKSEGIAASATGSLGADDFVRMRYYSQDAGGLPVEVPSPYPTHGIFRSLNTYVREYGAMFYDDAGQVGLALDSVSGQGETTGDTPYFYVSIIPTKAVPTEEVVVLQSLATVQYPPDGQWDWRYIARGAERVAFLGDSVTYQAINNAERYGTWRWLVLDALLKRATVREVAPTGFVEDSYSRWRVHMGIGGLTAGVFATDVGSYIAQTNPRPDHLHIMLGINDADAGVPAATFGAQMQAGIDAIKAAWPNCTILVSYPLPSSDGVIEAVRATYPAVIDALDNVDVVIDTNTGFDTGTMLRDSKHPNALGHAYMADLIAPAITLDGE